MGKKETGKKNCKVAGQVTPNGVRYESETAGSSGARYYLVCNKGEFTKKEIDEAKRYIKDNFDAITITVERNIYKKNK
jgi:hypothetical protein